jgi:hypothetical protein
MSEFLELFIASFAAGFIGSLFMTVSQEIDLRFINKRPISFSPVLALFKIFKLDFEVLSKKEKIIASYVVHFIYGTVWGFPLAIFYFFGYKDLIVIGIFYFLIVLIQGWIVIWALGISGPPWTWGYKAVFSEIIHKIIYTISVIASFVLFFS